MVRSRYLAAVLAGSVALCSLTLVTRPGLAQGVPTVDNQTCLSPKLHDDLLQVAEELRYGKAAGKANLEILITGQASAISLTEWSQTQPRQFKKTCITAIERAAIGSAVTDLEVAPALTKIEKAIDDQPLLKPSDLFTALAGVLGVLAGAFLADRLAGTRLSQSHRLARELQHEIWQIEQLRRAADEVISLSASARNYAQLLQAGQSAIDLRSDKLEADVAAHKLHTRLRLLANHGLTNELEKLRNTVTRLTEPNGPLATNNAHDLMKLVGELETNADDARLGVVGAPTGPPALAIDQETNGHPERPATS